MMPRKTVQLFLHKKNKGVYQLTYKAPSADFAGMPRPNGSDIVNLVRVSGRISAPAYIVTSEYDFNMSFEQVNFVDLDVDDTTAPAGEKD